MSNYVKATNFTSKDSLLTGNPAKIIKGAEIDDEFNLISTAIATKPDSNSPTLTGIPVAPTAAAGTNTTQIATTAFVTNVTSTLGTMSTQNKTAVDITGGTVVGITDLAVADGGTGVSTLAANAVVLGNGTNAVQTVAPSTSGNVLTSNGTTWTSAAPASLGVGQTYQNVSGSRNLSTGYTNSTGKPIAVYLTISTTGGGNSISITATVSGVVIQSLGYSFSQSTNNTVGVNFIVPDGQTYSIAASSNGGGISSKVWIELR